MLVWPLTAFLLLFVGLSSFGLGLIIGADVQRERLLKQLREERRQNVAEQPWFPRGHS